MVKSTKKEWSDRMIEVHVLDKKTGYPYRCLIPVDTIKAIVEDPSDNAVLIVYKKKKGFFRRVNRWIEIVESFDEIKKRLGMKEAISLENKEAISLENIEVTRLDKFSDEGYRLLKWYDTTRIPHVVKDSILITYIKK